MLCSLTLTIRLGFSLNALEDHSQNILRFGINSLQIYGVDKMV